MHMYCPACNLEIMLKKEFTNLYIQNVFSHNGWVVVCSIKHLHYTTEIR